MANPLFGHCIEPPPDIGLVRSRLIPEAEGALSPRLVLAVGAPGTGKTTLLRQAVAHVEGHVSWYRPSGVDPGPGRMLSCFAEALAAALHAERAGSFSELVTGVGRLDHQLHFVVDDFHLLAGSTAEAELEQLLTLDSDHLRFLVAGRHGPRINLAKSELRTAFTVNGRDLRFRAREIDQLFRSTYKQPLSPEGVSNLARQTDGWAAALHLFRLATKSLSPVEQRRAAESLSASPRFARDYLAHHFLAGISSEMEELLRATCLLQVLTPARCNAVLDRQDCQRLLQGLEHLGVLSTEDEGRTYRSPHLLQQYLIGYQGDAGPGSLEHLRHRTAVILEQEGAVGEGLMILAQGKDWEGVTQLLGRAGKKAVLPGMCGWAALIPGNILRDNAWAVLASARQLIDDGHVASAHQAVERIPALTSERECIDLARDLHLRSAVWAAEGAPLPVGGRAAELRDALRRDPGAVARALTKERRSHVSLPAALSLLLAGDQRSALPVLRRSAEQLDVDPAGALAAQLALAVFGPGCLGPATEAAAAEVDAVQREAERRGYTWLSRLASGVQAALPGTPACQDAVHAVIESCEVRGDEWGASVVAATGALMRLRAQNPGSRTFEALALRFRRLSAGTLEAWARAAQALVSATLDLPEVAKDVQTAEAFARTADVPGALAVTYAAMALQKPEDYADLMHLATRMGQASGLVCRPWTWLARGGVQQELHGYAKRSRADTVRLPPDQSAGRRTDVPQKGTQLPLLQISCFGGFALRRNETGLDLSTIRPQAKTVLRILSLNAGRLVHREQLAGFLWADLEHAAALHALQVSVSCLRGALRPEGTSESQQLLVRQGEAYALLLGSGSTLDLADFDRALHTAAVARTAGDTRAAAEALRRAVEIYSGEVLPEDGPADWVADTRERYRLRAAEAASSLAGVELGLGNSEAAAAAATRSVEIDPWRDESWRTLVETFQHLGDPVAAQRAQKRYDVMLDSLGVSADRTDAGSYDGAVAATAPGTEAPRRQQLDRPDRWSRRS